jgi:hypothetical protein
MFCPEASLSLAITNRFDDVSIEQRLKALADRWAGAPPAERSKAQSYVNELCEALGVEKPRPAGEYVYEFPVRVVNREGTETTNFVDLFKRGHFLLEAKDQGADDPDTILLRKAYGQARTYAGSVGGGPPPYILVLDVGRNLLLWDRWSGAYGGFNAATRVHLPTLHEKPEAIALLRDVFDNPEARNPNIQSAAVTKDIAEQLANLAASLEERGYEQERIARFLIRCVFTMFAEDTGLIPDYPFTHAIDEIGFESPEEFSVALAGLWRAMDEGSRFGLKKFLRFNGHFFRDQEVLPLTKQDLVVLRLAAESKWDMVEPSIMGTLLVRALDRDERHRLGAEFTPREFVERVVRPTVEEPIRERWTAVQAEVLQLRNPAGKSDRTRRDHERQALERLREFHAWLCSLKFLDPACGSGNFLYVTLAIVKQVELEVLRAIEEITGAPELAVEEVGPWQFHGIEVKHWAREIAELTLWIGYHQWWRRTHGHTLPPEPVLRDTGTLECRDAVLAWDDTTHVPERDRPDPTPRIQHPVTHALVPDPDARLPYIEHVNPKRAPWPAADFIVGNPPYMGSRRMRLAFGDGYVEALHAAYPDMPHSADYVMYWWVRAAKEVAVGRALRAGLITTNSIVQKSNRVLIARAADDGALVRWAIADHPWVDDVGSAAVRVALTVISRPQPTPARLVQVDRAGSVIADRLVDRLNSDLSAHADVARASLQPLRANVGLARRGVILRGDGFELKPDEAWRVLGMDERYRDVVRPWISGTDLVDRDRQHFVIDFNESSYEQAERYAVPFQIVRDRVKPERAGKKEREARELWWRFWNPRPDLRTAIGGLPRYLVTAYVSKHRFFQFAPTTVVPDDNVVAIALSDSFSAGVLSSDIHTTWADAAGGRMGVGNDPRYNSQCFTSFPFPPEDCNGREQIGALADQVLQHRRDALLRDVRLTTTELYNVVAKIKAGTPLTDEERRIHEIGACSVLTDLHERLNAAVAAAYGWPWPLSNEDILERLVELHDERRAEENSGRIRWLRREYQATGQPDAVQELAIPETNELGVPSAQSLPAWPAKTVDQLAAILALLDAERLDVESVAQRFAGARREMVSRHLETLALMGELTVDSDGLFSSVKRPA